MFVPKEVQIDELAQKIYFKEPQSSHSIQLVTEDNIETLFFILLELLKKGIQILYNNNR
jgi:uncharacterized Fe-S radical SAM superfamily protein PflX